MGGENVGAQSKRRGPLKIGSRLFYLSSDNISQIFSSPFTKIGRYSSGSCAIARSSRLRSSSSICALAKISANASSRVFCLNISPTPVRNQIRSTPKTRQISAIVRSPIPDFPEQIRLKLPCFIPIFSANSDCVRDEAFKTFCTRSFIVSIRSPPYIIIP